MSDRLIDKVRELIADPAFWDHDPSARDKKSARPLRARRWWEPTSGRVLFESGMSGGGYHETVLRLGRWVLCLARDTNHWHGARTYQLTLRREPDFDAWRASPK